MTALPPPIVSATVGALATTTGTDNVAVAVLLPESVTWAVRTTVPVADGVQATL